MPDQPALNLALPGDNHYALSRSQFIGRPTEILPRAVARCADTAAVAAALAMARARGLPFAIRAGGHCNADHSSTDGLLIDLTPHDSITVDGDLVTVGPGVRIGQLAAALAPLERLVPTGSCPSVSVVGAALGGGFGSHGRSHGLTCDAMVAADVLLADGRVVPADADLLWALRGAGAAGFGVVTSATFRTVRAVPRTHLRLAWPIEHASALIRHWQAWAPDAPDAVAVELVLLSPDHPDDPPLAMLIGAVPDFAAVSGFLDDLGVPPRLAETAALSAAEAALLHATPYSATAHDATSIPLVSDRPGMSSAKTEFFDHPLPDHAIDALLAHFTAAREPGELREIAFTPWRGAYARETDSAFPHRTAAFLVKHTVLIGPRGAVRRGHEALAWLAASWATVHPHGTGGVYVNFADPDLPDHLTSHYGSTVDRLRVVKAKYDPDDIFGSAQPLGREPTSNVAPNGSVTVAKRP
ncbi:FAD-binding oxidoreductase [Actinokineospora sp. HUAS TT18]|uniref:FAD-binding oxidoreductase n=1 Tax=Actinokineospora sp. HUAS TT18 TaxID=3447451 RepID=UPI003F522623